MYQYLMPILPDLEPNTNPLPADGKVGIESIRYPFLQASRLGIRYPIPSLSSNRYCVQLVTECLRATSFYYKFVLTWMSPDVVLEKKLFRDVALVAAADGARVRVVAGVSSNVNAETKTKKL